MMLNYDKNIIINLDKGFGETPVYWWLRGKLL